MSDRNITLVEYHSHGDGPRLFPNLFERGEQEADEDGGAADQEADEEGGGRGLAVFLALGLMIAMAVGYRYYRSGGESAEFETEQVEVTEYEN